MPLKIGYLTCKDPHDRYIWSGIIHMMYVALKEHAGEVEIIGLPRPLWIRLFWHALDKTRKLTRQLDGIMPNLALSKAYGQFFGRKIRQSDCDVIFAPIAASELAFLKTSVPVFYLSDSTFKAQEGYYFPASDMSRIDRWQGNLLQRRTLHRVAGILLTSDWAAASAVRDYGADPARISVIPFGANIDHAPDPVTLGSGSSDGKCRLLFVGVDWKRKGGQIAFETLQALRRRGIDAELTIVGCTPDLQDPNVSLIPFLNRKLPESRARIEQLYREADFFLLPTRAECLGVVFCEASAFGLPSIATDTGGVSSVVREGINGYLLPLDARGDAYAETIANLWADPARYRQLRRTSRELYDSTLNWCAWAKSVREVMLAHLAAKQPHSSPKAS